MRLPRPPHVMTQQKKYESLELVDSPLKLLDTLVKFLEEFLSIAGALPEVLSVEAAGEDVHLNQGKLGRVCTTGELAMLKFQLYARFVRGK